MKHLLIGGHGIIGSALREELFRSAASFAYTDRQGRSPGLKFDLLTPNATLPAADVTYLVAGVPSFAACETDRLSWRVNVDGVIAVAKRCAGFLVYVSSDAVEWCGGTALARQKAQVESYLRTVNAAIVRPAKVTHETAPGFAHFMLGIARDGRSGVYRWSA